MYQLTEENLRNLTEMILQLNDMRINKDRIKTQVIKSVESMNETNDRENNDD